jgi:cytochrome c553
MMFDHLRFAAPMATLMVVLGLACRADAQAPNDGPAGAPRRGAVIAAQGTPTGAQACAQCHAFDGVSDGTGAFPRIAAQSGYYLAAQLRAFASGVRTNSVMSAIAKALTPQDIADVTAYYAGLHPPFLPLAKPDAALIKSGEELATVGNETRGVQACDNCHGPGGAGEPPAIPYLAGQYASYIALELHMWQRGFRNTSPNEMAPVARALDDQQIAALAAYYQQVRGDDNVAASP